MELTETERDRLDASRYRYLRDADPKKWSLLYKPSPNFLWMEYTSKELDDVIDEAVIKEQER
jgi:hypothetical protein